MISTELFNEAFYNPQIQKFSATIENKKDFFQQRINEDIIDINILQYFDAETKNYISGSRVFHLVTKEGEYKARLCANKVEAKKLANRNIEVEKTLDNKAKLLKLEDNVVLFEFLQGKNLTASDATKHLEEIAQLQIMLNKQKYGSLTSVLEKNVTQLIKESISTVEQIDKRIYQKLLATVNTFPQLIPVLDHQDFGIHNLISDEDKIYLIDEEAFGILPLGYAIVRATMERPAYGLGHINSFEEYIKYHPQETQKYVKENKKFFFALHTLRNCKRRFDVGNSVGVKKLLKEFDQYDIC